LEARQRKLVVRAFKKGPDYIDAAWLEWASGNAARNLDTHLMGRERVAGSFTWNAVTSGLNVIEGNRGLYDGLDARGTHSTAELAKLLQAPVVLVLNARKLTRTAAALVLGCQKLDPELWIAGVVINQLAGSRHERVIREAVESACGVPVLGAIPRASADSFLPMRHLGLVTPQEFPERERLARNLDEMAGAYLDFGRLMEIAHTAPPLPTTPRAPVSPDGSGLIIGYLKDSAFSFYYPENLDALRASGVELAAISALDAASLPPELDALYIGGGFPETHAQQLSANSGFLASVRRQSLEGLPIYAECGGLMFLSRAVNWRGGRFPMSGVLPFEVHVVSEPQGHGYVELLVDRENPFFPVGARLRGHEFHYSKILAEGCPPPTACAVLRGAGCCAGRDAVLVHNVWAAYTHLHALGTPDWAEGVIRAARAARVPA
jgi:cobyrinic acid a,c-diamide synthase